MTNTALADFDPITFLDIQNIPADQQEKLRTVLNEDIINFLLNKFTEPLTDEELIELEARLPDLQNYDQVIALISQYEPHFAEQRNQYLSENKTEFKKKHLN